MTPTCFGCSICDAGSASTQEDDHAAPCWQALRTTVTYAGMPTIGNAQSLSFLFYSPGRLSKEGQHPRRDAACFRSSCTAGWTISLGDRRVCYAEAAWNILIVSSLQCIADRLVGYGHSGIVAPCPTVHEGEWNLTDFCKWGGEVPANLRIANASKAIEK